MILIGFGTYPMQSTKEVTKRFLDIPRLPEYIKGKGNYVYITTEGVTGITIYEFESAKVEEATEQISNAYWRFHDVPGYSFQLIHVAKARDAAKKILELA
jgi:hypothetical protein